MALFRDNRAPTKEPLCFNQLPIEFQFQDLVVIFYEVSSMFSYSFRAWELSDYGNIYLEI